MPFGKGLAKHKAVIRQIERSTQKNTVAKVNQRVTRLAREVMPEVKHIGVQDNLNLPINEANIALNRRHYFDILPGNGPQDRIGNKVKALGLKWRFLLRATSDTTQNRVHMVRMVLLLDKRTNNAAMNLADYNITGGPSSLYLDPSSLRNEEFRKRFRVIFDKVIRIGGKTSNAGNYSTDADCQRFISGGIKFKKPVILTYNNASAAGLPVDTVSGSFYMLQLDTTNSTAGCSLDLECRLYFSDA